ncbi:MAG: hypothetical protein ACXQS4_03885 [Methermicoccaceae archaeon]
MKWYKVLYKAAPGKSIAAATEDDTITSLDTEVVSTITVFVKITYNASATKGAKINIYPRWCDGETTHTCTSALVEFSVPLDTSNPVIWASLPVDVADVGSVAIKVENSDPDYALTLDSIAVNGSWR